MTAFQGFPNVRYLQLGYNDIHHIARRTFELVPDVRSVGLAFNKLTGVEYGKLTYLENLLRVWLRSNPLTCNPVLPNTVIEVDFFSAAPACLPIGCVQRVSETALKAGAAEAFSSKTVAEAVIPGSIEMVIYMTRRDTSQFLDDLNLKEGMYADYGLGERCWCAPVARCFPTPVVACPPGTLGNPCGNCPVDHFCPGNNQSYPCPERSHAPDGGASACSCRPGFFGPDGSVCEPCPEGSWCPGGASPVACPAFETSPEGSAEPGSCTCMVGFGRCESTFHASVEHASECLSLRTPPLPWNASRAKCIEAGGDLATLISAEDDGVALALAKTQGSRVWFGLDDQESEGIFQLPDKTAVTYFNWAQASPPLANEDCVSFSAVDGASGWHDDVCEEAR
eukprot:2368749-Rhodomonas_salina.1